jgi:hypothetical protein
MTTTFAPTPLAYATTQQLTPPGIWSDPSAITGSVGQLGQLGQIGQLGQVVPQAIQSVIPQIVVQQLCQQLAHQIAQQAMQQIAMQQIAQQQVALGTPGTPFGVGAGALTGLFGAPVTMPAYAGLVR